MSEIDLYGSMENAYFARNSTGVHFLSTFLEKQVRLATCLSYTQLAISQSTPRLPRSAGLGGYLECLRQIMQFCRTEGIHAEMAELSDAIISQFGEFGDESKNRTIKEYRDYLAHGGIEPAGQVLSDALRVAISNNASAIREYLVRKGGVIHSAGKLQLRTGTTLYPLIIDSGSTLAIFQGAFDQSLTYYTLDSTAPTIEFTSADQPFVNDVAKFLSAPPSAGDRKTIVLFHEAIRRDIRGFLEPHAEYGFIGSYSPFTLEWARKTSEGPQYRTDQFRINTNNAREWMGGAGWRPYTDFLKSVSNWSIIIRRSLDRLNSIEESFRRMETEHFSSLSSLNLPKQISTKFSVRDTRGTSFSPVSDNGPVDLENIVDESATSSTGVPQVFFVTGEAGIGKTFSLFRSSKVRAQSLTETDDDVPIYLYISCSGVGLKKVEDIINAAVVGTQNLTFDSVLTLSRNGLLVLVIDGFDELVGGSGYGDAFQLLRPVLDRLGGSGTILLSARSSYFANQYQKSLHTAEQIDQVPAHHLVLEVQRWSRSDIDQLFNANQHWLPYRSTLNGSDFSLLGVPFFAQAFNDAVSEASASNKFNDLRSTLIDSYLARETKKLVTHGGQSPVSQDQLRLIFQEISGLLFESGESSLDLEQFKLACESALEIDGFHGANQALGDRLTVLCGMSAAADTQTASSLLFSFQHDLFFEVMLADYLGGQYLRSKHGDGAMLAALNRSPLGDATISSLSERYQQDLAKFLSEPSVSVKDPDSTLSLNIAALVGSLINNFQSPPSDWYQDIHFGTIDLSQLDRLNLTFANCSIDRLCLDSNIPGSVKLYKCAVIHLEGRENEVKSMSSLTLDAETTIQESSSLDPQGRAVSFDVGNTRVLESLFENGAQGIEDRIAEIRKSKQSALEIFAIDVLNGMSARGENAYIVEARSRMPGNSAGRGMLHPHDANWASLTDALVKSDVATLKVVNASGPPKYTVKFNFTSTALCQRESELAEIRSFWAELSSR